MGKWIQRDVDRHRHDHPLTVNTGTVVAIGDIWECACGSQFRVTDARYHYDTRPGESYRSIEWAPINSHRP